MIMLWPSCVWVKICPESCVTLTLSLQAENYNAGLWGWWCSVVYKNKVDILTFGCGAQSTSSSWHNEVTSLCVHMLELVALDSTGRLISIALAAGHLPHGFIKVMKNHLRELVPRSGCHLLPANTAHPGNEEGNGDTTLPRAALFVMLEVNTCFTNHVLLLKVSVIMLTLTFLVFSFCCSGSSSLG